LGTSYPDVAVRVVEVVRNVRAYYKGRLALSIDGTGVGLPIVDLVKAALKGAPNLDITAIMFTHGDRFDRKSETASLGKAFLVSRLQALLQTQCIKLPDTDEARQLAEELANYEIKITADANDTYGAFKVGTHDDLVTALGLAVLPPGPDKRMWVGSYDVDGRITIEGHV
jgi:hypothetical protein